MADFEDGKDADALRTIGEVSEALDIKPHVLRYWEQQFSLLKPLKRSGGRRYYRPGDVALVEEISRLVNEEGYTLKGAEAVLRQSGKPGMDWRSGELRAGERRSDEPTPRTNPAQTTSEPDRAELLAGLKSIRKRLAAAINA